MARIICVEDNECIREAVAEYLRLDDHQVIDFAGAKGVIECVKRGAAELIILDIMLPDGNGFALAKAVRQCSTIPIIFLSAKNSESDRILGFELGADDYIVKPFSTRELALRVQALLKRCAREAGPGSKTGRWALGDESLSIEETAHRAERGGEELRLTAAEWKILVYLARREGIVVSRERILSDCLNYAFEGSERTVDTHIANVRSKLGSGNWIETVRGYGYRFNGVPENGRAS